MKERIFIISPISEDEEEEKLPYDEQGNTTAMAYYNEQGNTIETDYEEQPKENSAIEKHIIIIYEAPKPKVINQGTQTPEAIPIFSTPKEIPTTNPYPQPEINRVKTQDTYGAYGNIPKYINGEIETPGGYGNILKYIYGEQSSEQPPIEQNQLVSIRSELAEITIAAGAPAPQAGELQTAA